MARCEPAGFVRTVRNVGSCLNSNLRRHWSLNNGHFPESMVVPAAAIALVVP